MAHLQQSSSGTNETTVQDILNLLDEGETKIKMSASKDVILFLGITGTGKTTASLFIAGYDDYIIAEKNPNGKGYTVTDTLDSNIDGAIYDCPGYTDSRGPLYDISASYFTKKIIDHAERVKLVFTISYAAVDSDNKDKKSFPELLNYGVAMMTNIAKFNQSIGLIVTKVKNEYDLQEVNGTLIPTLVPNEIVIKDIDVKNDLNTSTTSNKAEKIQFINALLTKANGNYTNIGILRQPNQPGKYRNITILQDLKPSLLKVVNNNIVFKTHKKSDFRHTISDNSKIYLRDLIEKINEDIVSNIAKICKEIEKYCSNRIEPFNDFQDLHNKFRMGYNLFSSTKTAAISFEEPRQMVEQITKNIISLNITVSNENFQNIINLSEYLQFIKTINNELTVVKPVEWAEGLTNLVTYLDDSQRWYNFLINFYDILSKYHVQQHYQQHFDTVEKLENQIKLNEKNPSVISKELKLFLDKVSKADSEKEYDNIKNIRQLSAVKLKFLNNLLNLTLKYNVDSSCDSDNNLIIKGQYVRLNEANSASCKKPKSIRIFALDKVFIDTDLNKTGDRVQLSIIAPKLEIIGSPSIILNGSPGASFIDEQAKNASKPGAKGENGNPGNPGGPTGHFISISQNVANSEHLKLSIVGGKGGTGQKGGNGKEGQNGTIPPVPKDDDDPWWDEREFEVKDDIKMNMINSGDFPRSNFVEWKARWWVRGKDCTDGGNGGDGGIGGKGGNSLDPIVVNLMESPKFEITIDKGAIGIGGPGGKGAAGGKQRGQLLTLDGYSLKAVSSWQSPTPSYKYTVVSREDLKKCSAGHEGLTGKNDANIKESEEVSFISLPSAVINDYKNYVRDNMSNNMMESFLRKFLDGLEHHESLKKLYDIHGIDQYADELHAEKRLTDDNKKVLGFLHTSVLSRIYSINNSAGNKLVLDLDAFLKERIREIKKLKELESVVSVNDERKRYQNSLLEKINEAQNFVEEHITSELNNVLHGVDHQIELLVEETIALQNETEAAKDKIEKTREQLKNAGGLKVLVAVLKTASQFLSFLGPVAGAAGAVIGGGIMVSEALYFKDSDGGSANPVDLPNAVKNSVAKITEQLKDEQSLFKAQLDDTQHKLKDFSEEKPSTDMSDIQKKISEVKQQLEKEMNVQNSIDVEAVDKLYKMRKDVQDFLQKKREMLENKKTRGNNKNNVEDEGNGEGEKEKKEDEINLVKVIENTFGIIKIPLDYYNRIKNDEAKIDELGRAMRKLDENLYQLRVYEQLIYQIIAPTCRNLEDKINKMGSNLQGQSHAALDISKWRIQDSLRDMKLQMKQMTQGFRVQETLVRSIEKLEEGMTIMIKMYDRIEDYHDKAELSDYIANIYSNRAGQIKIENDELRREVDSLKWIIQSNLVLEKYEVSMNSFKQRIFPFGDYFFAEFELPSNLVSNDTNSLVVASDEKISLLRSKLEESKITMTEYDQYIHSRVPFNSNLAISKPFFVWSHDEYKNAIKQLLLGEKIILKSDIMRGSKQNAIKFNVVGINFKLENETMQSELNEQLKYLKVEMMHMGTSYYRCHNKFYTIVSDNQTLMYTFMKNENGVPQDSSDSYKKLEKYEPFLSPYTLWSIQLRKYDLSKDNIFASLANYTNEKIDLELEGVGQYVDKDFTTLCNDNLNKYYAVDDTISLIDNINSQNKHPLQEIPRDSLFSTRRTGLMTYGYFNPINKISHWFTKEDKIIEEEDFMTLDDSASVATKWTNIPSTGSELPTFTNTFINDDTSAVDSLPNYFSICNNENLLLLDLIIPWTDSSSHCLCVAGEVYCWWQKYVASKSRSSDNPISPEEEEHEEDEGEEDVAEDEEDEDDPSSWTTEEESDYAEGPSESPEASGESALLEASGEQQDDHSIAVSKEEASAPETLANLTMSSSSSTTTTATTTTTVRPTRAPATCLVMGRKYQEGEVLPHSTGNCVECSCGSEGRIECSPRDCVGLRPQSVEAAGAGDFELFDFEHERGIEESF
ncbi:hypothetical protein TSAR_008879 [Trichomalopsis sarcophagae]|uniref:Uncharacterized protein n=1 Tax=Trichomalopsis sarcophagae TaxID=543379 RepID=A0A232FF72_9HYME|nr:hypothetical protein TSAR_008879 [Trichomalopsis sarcophagae]